MGLHASQGLKMGSSRQARETLAKKWAADKEQGKYKRPGGENVFVQRWREGLKIQRGQGDRRQVVGRGGKGRYQISAGHKFKGTLGSRCTAWVARKRGKWITSFQQTAPYIQTTTQRRKHIIAILFTHPSNHFTKLRCTVLLQCTKLFNFATATATN
jgi:hypothetical protein